MNSPESEREARTSEPAGSPLEAAAAEAAARHSARAEAEGEEAEGDQQPAPAESDEEAQSAGASDGSGPESSSEEPQESSNGSLSASPHLDEGEGSVAAPIRAMRVIKLSQNPPRAASSSSPSIEVSEAIETADASIDDLDDAIDEEELGDLEPTPAPDAAIELMSGAPEVASTGPAAPAVSAPPPPPRPPAADAVAFEELTPETSEPIIPEEFEVPPAERKPPPPRRSAKPSLPQAQKPRKKPWWETLFGDDFSRAYRPMTASQLAREVDFILEGLSLPQGAVILDLGCGQGEICVELARRGFSVVGYDLSVYQLAMAGDNAQQAKQKINFLQGDMREMAFEGMFDAVISWDTSFGYFEEDKNTDILRRVYRALKPGGRFILDVLNRDFVAVQAPYSRWFEGDGCVCMDDMTMDWITNRMKVKRSIILDDGRSKELQYSVRLYGLSDVGRLLHEVGFRVTGVSGDVATPGAFFGPQSRRILIQATRP